MQVPLHLALMHQAGALIVFGFAIANWRGFYGEMPRQTEIARHVEQPADAGGGIDHQTGQRAGGPFGIALQQIIHDHRRQAQIGQGIVDRAAQTVRHILDIGVAGRMQKMVIDP